jgi:hypothetical protein
VILPVLPEEFAAYIVPPAVTFPPLVMFSVPSLPL